MFWIYQFWLRKWNIAWPFSWTDSTNYVCNFCFTSQKSKIHLNTASKSHASICSLFDTKYFIRFTFRWKCFSSAYLWFISSEKKGLSLFMFISADNVVVSMITYQYPDIDTQFFLFSHKNEEDSNKESLNLLNIGFCLS